MHPSWEPPEGMLHYELLVKRVNQRYPFYFWGRSDDAQTYDKYRALAY